MKKLKKMEKDLKERKEKINLKYNNQKFKEQKFKR